MSDEQWAMRRLRDGLENIKQRGGYGQISFTIQNNQIIFVRFEQTMKSDAKGGD